MPSGSRSIHPAHATAARHWGHLLLLLLLRHHALSGEEQSRNGGGVLQRRAGDLGRVDDAGRDQILVLVGLGVVAVVRSEEHTSELQSHSDLVCRLLLEKKKQD